jgi:hypothetical protein
MRPAKDLVGTYGVRFSAAMARMRFWVVAIAWRRIGNARTQRHVWTRGIVIANSHSQNGPQMRFRAQNPRSIVNACSQVWPRLASLARKH